MAFKVELNHLHIAPRKVRLVADLVRGKKAEEAQTILNFAIKRASDPILKLLIQDLPMPK
jgi:large subunit ribosomal protein L22